MRADRLLSLLLLLQTKGRMTAQDLAERLEVSERTIYRDLSALGAAGVPVYAERGPGGGCRLLDGYRTNLTGLNEAEARTIFMAGAPGPLRDLGLGNAQDAALVKLLAALPAVHRRDAERARQRVHLDAAGWFRFEEAVPHLRVIQEGVWQDQRLRITYRKSNKEVVERVIEPLGLVAKASVWYLVANSAGDRRVFRVSRVLDVTPTGELFERSEDFDLAAYWEEWCAWFEQSVRSYKVTLLVAPEFLPTMPLMFGDGVRRLIERADPPDADGWLTLTLSFESMDMARHNVLSCGAMVEVIEPQELRESVMAFASEIAAFYSKAHVR